VAAVELKGILQRVEPLAGRLVAAIGEPAIGLQQRRRAQIPLAVPPIARTAGGAAEAKDAFVKAVELLALLGALQTLAGGRRRLGLQPGLYGGILGVGAVEVGHQVLDHRHVWQWVDRHLAINLVDELSAGERISAVDVHGTAATNTFATRAAEGKRRIDLVFDLDQRVENHRPAGVEIDLVTVHTRILVIVRAPAINREGTHICRPFHRLVRGANTDPRVLRKCEFYHGFSLSNGSV